MIADKCKSVIRCSLVAAAMILCIGGFSACNTVDGAGEDIESIGESIQEGGR